MLRRIHLRGRQARLPGLGTLFFLAVVAAAAYFVLAHVASWTWQR